MLDGICPSRHPSKLLRAKALRDRASLKVIVAEACEFRRDLQCLRKVLVSFRGKDVASGLAPKHFFNGRECGLTAKGSGQPGSIAAFRRRRLQRLEVIGG